jgi:hypothetical protein
LGAAAEAFLGGISATRILAARFEIKMNMEKKDC